MKWFALHLPVLTPLIKLIIIANQQINKINVNMSIDYIKWISATLIDCVVLFFLSDHKVWIFLKIDGYDL